MTTPTIVDYLKYANLQMAAEAFMNIVETGEKLYAGDDLKRALVAGNTRSLLFTQTQAEAFADPNTGWTVLDQEANTTTGFSGTLFRNKANPSELVISFRSTEFLDDAARDNKATNELEIAEGGFALGQIADMEAWYAKLLTQRDANGELILAGKTYSVTGYSLGGHLATAFNLLRQEELQYGPPVASLDQVVTFNGAGVGLLKQGSLGDAINDFRNLLASPTLIKTRLDFSIPTLASFYDTLRTNLATNTWTAAQAKAALNSLTLNNPTEIELSTFAAEKAPLTKALNYILDLQSEALRLTTLTGGGTGTDANATPKLIPDADILAETLDYRLAVDLVARNTEAASLIGGVIRGISGKEYGDPPLAVATFTGRDRLSPFAFSASRSKSRRWRDGDPDTLPGNDTTWRYCA